MLERLISDRTLVLFMAAGQVMGFVIFIWSIGPF